MGKIIAGGAIVVAVVLFFLWQKGPSDSAPMAENMKQQMDVTEEKSEGMVSSIKDAMGLGKKMQCTYAMGMGDQNIQSTVLVDGERYQSTTVMANMTTYALFDGETQYTWTSAAKTGTKMSKACMDEMTAAVKDMPTSNQETALSKPEDMKAAFDMAKNVSCTPASGETLVVPTDVTFTDQCAMMKQSMDMMKQMQDKMPQGMTVPGMPQN